MENIFKKILDFLNNNLETKVYIKEMLKYSEIVDGNRSGTESLSFINGALDEIKEIGTFEEDNKLRIQALLCDIFNNMAHSLQASKIKNVSTDDLCSQAFAMKKGMVFEIIRECQKTNNKSYGIISDEEHKDNIFVVDIPGCGQVKWHFPKRIKINSKTYPFKVVDNGKQTTNKSLILQEKSSSEVKLLSEHNQKVINSFEVEEMNEALGLSNELILGLSDKVKEPTTDELEFCKKGETRSIDNLEIPEN